MNLADVFTVTLVIVALLTAFVGVWLMAAGLWPDLIGRCADRIGSSPVRCGITGLVALVPLIVVAVAIGRLAPSATGKLLSVALIICTLLGALVGTAGLAMRIGRGLASSRDQQEPWRRVLRGGVALALSYLTIVMLPLTLLPGFGALMLACFKRSGVSSSA